MVANSQDDILEDRELKATLDESKVQSVQIEATLKDMENTMKQIETIREGFVPVATRVSRLFFVLTDLINVDPMYQYSLEFFRLIYESAIKSIEGVIEKGTAFNKQRKEYFISEFTWRLYKNVCRSLFEKDKLLFSWLICLKIMDEVQKDTGGLDYVAVRFLMAGATQVEMTKPNPTGDSGWLSDKSWLSFLEMSSSFKQFKGFDDEFVKNLKDWQEIYNNSEPQDCVWPGKWQDLNILNRTIVISILRPDKVRECIQTMIRNEKELGEKYLSPPPFDMNEVFTDSTNKQPIIIVLSAGADPMRDIIKLSSEKKIMYESLSLGAGQAQKAIRAIKEAQKTQTWVVLQNCHLAPSFMPTLDGLIEEIVVDPYSSFRIWLTTMPSD